jgi:DNA-binding CsgD family transcriptional regulator/PAS domain-containing protein
MHDEAFARLVGDVYEAPYDAALWQRVVGTLRTMTDSRFVLVTAVDLRRQEYSRSEWHGPDDSALDEGLREYVATMTGQDPLLAYAGLNPTARFAESRAALRAMGRDTETDPYVRWCAARLRSGHNAVCYTLPADGISLGVSLNLPLHKPAYAADEIARFRTLFEHMNRAIRLAARPPDFSASGAAVMALDGGRRLLAASPAAEQALRAADGLALVHGRVMAGSADADAALAALVARTAGQRQAGLPGGAIAVPRPSGALPWLLAADPLPRAVPALAPFMPAVLLRIVERETRPRGPDAPDLATLFGLTPTEARLLDAVLAGDGALPRAADALRLKQSTARVHMRHILAKAGVRSQAELHRLIQRLDR